MTRDEMLDAVNRCLSKVLESDTEVTEDTDLIEEEILDSLDAATFVFELEKATGKKLPEGDLDDMGLYKVSNLLDYLGG